MAVDSTAFESFLKQNLEELTRLLINAEVEERFAPGTIEVIGGATQDLADGGQDLLVEISGPAMRKVHHNLIPDAQGAVWYSCKSTKSTGKETWTGLVRHDVDPANVYNSKKRQFAENAAERAEEKPPNASLISAMANGAHYWIVVNVGAANPRAFEAEIEKRLGWYVRRATSAPCDLKGKVRVCDANHLAAVYNSRPLTLPARLEKLLGPAAPTFLQGWEKWTHGFESERRGMDFQADEARLQLLDDFKALLAAGPESVLRLAGPPGVGKTRLVHHALATSEDTSLRDRVRYAAEPKEVTKWLKDGGLDSIPNAVLVVDEVIADRASTLARAFGTAAAKHPDARLVIVGPKDDGNSGDPQPRLIEPLSRSSLRAVVRSEMSGAANADEALQNTVLDLCEGYPLFALWLSRALADSPQLLAAPGSKLTVDTDPWFATSLVLAGPYDALSPTEWKGLADRRGKAILLVVLAHDKNWEAFDSRTRASFEQALELPWPELRRAVAECTDRGLIRRVTDDRAYISPANLERLVLNHFFGGSRPPLPPKNILEHLRDQYVRLSERADSTHATAQAKKNLAKQVLDSLTASLLTEQPKSIRYAARAAPEHAAWALRPFVRAAAETMNSRAIEILSGLFEHLSFRRISTGAFSAVEESLFELSKDSDRARSAWTALFAPAIHLTRQPFELRFELLQRRLTSGTVQERTRAIGGLASAVDRGATRAYSSSGWDDADGPFDPPKNREVSTALDDGWKLLLETAGSEATEVAAAARSVVAKRLRGGITQCLQSPALDALADAARTWTQEQRAQLAEELDDVERYERANNPRVASELGPSLDHLRKSLSPRDLWERVLARVGRWHPGTDPIDSEDIEGKEADDDIRLAAELVLHPQVFFGHLEWFMSEKAIRAVSFARALGSADRERALFARLQPTELGRRHEEFFAHYVVGWGATAEAAKLDEWLEELLEDRNATSLVSRVIPMLPGTARRARLLLHAMSKDDFDSSVISGLGYWGRSSEVPADVSDELIAELSNRDENAKIAALGLVRQRLVVSNAQDSIANVARRLAIDLAGARLASYAELAWADTTVWLVKNGYPGALKTAAVDREGGHNNYRLERALQELCRAGLATEVWRELAEALDESRLSAIRLRWLLQQTHLLQHVPDGELQAWIRGNIARGLALASLASPYTDELDSASRLVLEEFGADSAPARELRARFASTPRAVNSIATFFAGQAENAKAWATSDSPEIRAWATGVKQLAEARAERHRAEEGFEARYGS